MKSKLLHAVKIGDAKKVQQLLEAAAWPAVFAAAAAPNGSTCDAALQAAACEGHTEVAELLLAAGAAVDAQNEQGITPLCYAASNGHTEMVQLLLSAGASIEQTCGSSRTTALQVAAEAGSEDAVPVYSKMSAVQQAGADPRVAGQYAGETALMSVALCRCVALDKQIQLLQLLLAAGAAVDASTPYGWTALHYAANLGNSAAAQVLVSAGASVNAALKSGRTPLHMAVECGSVRTVQVLLLGGAAVDTADALGSTPLAWAAAIAAEGRQPNCSEVFECFVQHHKVKPLPAVAVVAAAAAAARVMTDPGTRRRPMWTVRCDLPASGSAVSAVIGKLSALGQWDSAAIDAALQQHWPGGKRAAAVLAGVLLDLWLAAAAEQAELEAWLPVAQQMVMGVAAAQAEAVQAVEQAD